MNWKKILIALAVVFVTLFVVGGILLSGENGVVEEETLGVKGQAQVIENITPREAQDLIKKNAGGEKFAVIDLRTPEEYAAGHIEDATNLDYYSDAFRDGLEEFDKKKTHLIYCQSGRRSTAAFDVMKEIGFKEVYNLTGGIVGWQAEGLPIVE